MQNAEIEWFNAVRFSSRRKQSTHSGALRFTSDGNADRNRRKSQMFQGVLAIANLHLCNITTDAHFGTLVSCGEVVSIKKHRVIRIVSNPVAWCHRHFRRFYDKKRKSKIHGVFG